jgi:hypothetical protein
MKKVKKKRPKVYVVVQDLDAAQDIDNDGYQVVGVYLTRKGAETKVFRLNPADWIKVRIITTRLKG